VPGAEASISAGDVAFGPEPADNALIAFEDVTVTNDGIDPVTIGTPSLGGADPEQFDLAATTCDGASLAPAATCTVTVLFMPTAGGDFTAVVSLPNDAAPEPASFGVSGTGTPTPQGILVPDPPSLAFGAVAVGDAGTLRVEVTNSDPGFAPTLGQVGTPASPFAIATDTCSNVVLLPGAGCAIDVTFTPVLAADLYAGVLELASNTGTLSIPLAGSRAPASPPPDPTPPPPPSPPASPTPARDPFTLRLAPDAVSQRVRHATLTVTAARREIGRPALAFAGPDRGSFGVERSTCDGPLPASQSCAFRLGFTGRTGGNYEAAARVTAAGTTRQVELPAHVVLDAAALKRMLTARARVALAALSRGGLAKAIRTGLLVRGVSPGRAGVLRGVLRAEGRTLGALRRSVGDDGAATVRIRPTRAGGKLLRGLRSVRLQALLTFVADADHRAVRIGVSKTIRR
jgi:hypothetical protein